LNVAFQIRAKEEMRRRASRPRFPSPASQLPPPMDEILTGPEREFKKKLAAMRLLV
jgi:hypothetical protein